jgi:hypothetical protein
MGKLSEKNTFAKVLLIVALFYVVVSIILCWRYYKLVFMDMGISGFYDYATQLYPSGYAVFYTALQVLGFLAYILFPVLWIMWILTISAGAKSLRVPIIITFVYYVFNLCTALASVVIYRESAFNTVRLCGLPLLLFTAWLMLVIGSGKALKLVFAILRWIVAAAYILSDIRLEMSYIRALAHRSKDFIVSMLAVTSDLIADLIIAVFVLWILKPELFDKKEVKGQ